MTQFQIRLRRRGISKEEILGDLRRVSVDLKGQPVTRILYDERGEFGATTVIRNFGTWNSALAEAGLAISTRQDISDEELFENLMDVWSKIGRQPYGRDMSDKATGSKFSTGTYEKRFGSWNRALMAFSRFVSGADVETDTGKAHVASVKRTPRDVNWRLRAKILIRDCCICQMCGDSPLKNPDAVLHVDHKTPWTRGGETVEENLQTLCGKCNIGKSNEMF